MENIWYWNCASGFLKKIDFIKELIRTNRVDVFFLAETEIKGDANLDFLSIDGYDFICAKTLSTRNKARLACFKKNDIKLVKTSVILNDVIILESQYGIYAGVYRGFKCYSGETVVSNWERILDELNE